MKSFDICVDFDGTCCTHAYPNIGLDIGAYDVLNELSHNSPSRLILFTMRCEGFLDEAVEHLYSKGVSLFGINKHPTQCCWTTSPKAYGHLYIDDAALGCPLVHGSDISKRPFVDWVAVREMLVTMDILEKTNKGQK